MGRKQEVCTIYDKEKIIGYQYINPETLNWLVVLEKGNENYIEQIKSVADSVGVHVTFRTKMTLNIKKSKPITAEELVEELR